MHVLNYFVQYFVQLSVLVYDNMVTEVAMAAALTRSASATGSAIMDGNCVDSSAQNAGGDRVWLSFVVLQIF